MPETKQLTIIQPGDPMLLDQDAWDTPISEGDIYDGADTTYTRYEGVLLVLVKPAWYRFYQEWDQQYKLPRRSVFGWSEGKGISKPFMWDAAQQLPNGSRIVRLRAWKGLLIHENAVGGKTISYPGHFEPISIELPQRKEDELTKLGDGVLVKVDGMLRTAHLFYRCYRFRSYSYSSPSGTWEWSITPGPGLLPCAKENIVPSPDVLKFGTEVFNAAYRIYQGEGTVQAEEIRRGLHQSPRRFRRAQGRRPSKNAICYLE